MVNEIKYRQKMEKEEDLLIKKNPYMAVSPNLIEYFAIIGYKETIIPKIIDIYKKKTNPLKPTILSSIISKSDYGLIDNKLIISQVYPDNPLVLFIDEANQINEPPSTSNVIYSFCFDSQDGKEKLFYVCYAFKFYEKYTYRPTKNYKEQYYIPKAFCIISQYYYFTIFQHICKNIYNLIGDINNDMPLEIIVYNIINFIPSPIFYSLNLDLFSFSINEPSKYLGQMSGYPYLEFDLSEIFNLLPLNLVLEIYLFTFLEISIIFFCSDLELLNMIMFIMFVLNYPCNDSPYYWHIVSVSENNFIGENQFVGKFMVSFIGVHHAYYPDFNVSPFGKYHYIVDIDNKRAFHYSEELEEDRDIEDFENLKNIQIFIQNAFKEGNNENYVKNKIFNLKKNLENILSKNPEFNLNPKNKYVNFFKVSNSIMNINKKIQEIFYEFNLSILLLLFQDFTLNNSFQNIKKEETNTTNKKIYKLLNYEDFTELTKEENIFLKIYRSSSKYVLYFENYISNFETIDVFEISLMFSEEFINERITTINKNSTNKISLFKIMDSLFITQRSHTISITLNNIYAAFEEKLQKYFKRFTNPQKLKNAKNKLFSFNKCIINRYIYLLNNLFDEEDILEMFPYLKMQIEYTMPSMKKKCIINTIIEYLEDKDDIISTSNLLIYSCVYLFSISISLHSYKRMLNYINDIIKSLKFADLLKRQYIFIIMKTLYKYNSIRDTSNYSSIKMYFFMLTNFLKENLIIPNEEMLQLLNSFLEQCKNSEDNNISIKLSDKEDDNFLKIEDIKYYIKYCFTDKKMFTAENMINLAMNEYNVCNMAVRTDKKNLQPIIVLKLKEYICSTKLYSPKKIFKMAKSIYIEFFDSFNLDLNKLNIIKVKDCIINLIQYGIILNNDYKGIIPLSLLVNTLYILKDIDNKESKEIIQNNKNVNEENKDLK